ncbi:MAG TPA: phosphatase PAP2 family protein [Patescibacteria group bacterium]|jgi:undecaprenyl-diphosphatase|nr:phosphatase PAP2 family protein [Patescibacteria group bacterium]
MDLLIRLCADGLVVVIFIIAMVSFALKIPRDQWWSWGWRIVLGGLTAYLLAKIAGHFFQPETLRPFEKLGVSPKAAFLPNPGFPSDHVLFATFLSLAVWFSTKQKKLAITLLTLTVIMGVARVLALVHTPLDVIGGFLIGCTSIVWYRRSSKNVVQ